jgi:hypothetical protein
MGLKLKQRLARRNFPNNTGSACSAVDDVDSKLWKHHFRFVEKLQEAKHFDVFKLINYDGWSTHCSK